MRKRLLVMMHEHSPHQGLVHHLARGEVAIVPVLFVSPSHVKVRPLKQIPFERRFKKPGLATLIELHGASVLEAARERVVHNLQRIRQRLK